MPVKCNYCNSSRKYKDIVAHIRSEHMGKLSEESIAYLKSLGVDFEGEDVL